MLSRREGIILIAIFVMGFLIIYVPIFFPHSRPSFMEDVTATPEIPPWPEVKPDVQGQSLISSKPLLLAGAPAKVWLVQVGSFTEQSLARELMTALRKQGQAAYVEAYGSHWRVLVGPFLDKYTAKIQRDTINSKRDAKAIVVSL